jgi:ribosomal protein S18 acetylase RimI-like enzyme
MAQSYPAGLGPRFEQNLAVHASWLHRATPGMSVERGGGLLVADSGLDDDTFNFVGHAALTLQNAGDRISEVLAEVTATGRSFAWRVGPASAPRDLAALLTEAGLPPAVPEPAMWRGLDDPGTTRTHAATDLEVRIVGSDAELRDWAWVLAANWDPPSATVLEFYRRTAGQLLAPGGPARLLIGYSGGRPVCTAEVLVHAGAAGLYNISTLASRRRRGFGTAITAAALQAARAAGAGLALLTASDQGEPLYRQLGFTIFGALTEHPLPAVPAAPPPANPKLSQQSGAAAAHHPGDCEQRQDE